MMFMTMVLTLPANFFGSILNLFPDASQLVLDAIGHGIGDSAGGSCDDADDFAFDLKVDFRGSINDNGLSFVQSLDNLGFVFLDLGNDVIPDISLQLSAAALAFS